MRGALTCDLEGGVPTPHAAVLVARHAVVHAGVQLEARVQEEEAPVGQLVNGGEECSFRPAFQMILNRFVNKSFLHLSGVGFFSFLSRPPQ